MKDRQNQKGAALVAFAVVFVALAAAAAVAIDVSRLSLTATEVQALADTGANAGAIALVHGRDPIADAQAVARANQAEGNPGVLNSGDITTGHWEPASGWSPRSPSAPDVNAVHVEAHLTVNNIMAGGTFGTPTTEVTKSATAVLQTLGTANPSLPIALGNCVLNCYANDCCYANVCPATITMYFNSAQATNNVAWIGFSTTTTCGETGGVNNNWIEQYTPDGCGGGGTTPPTVTAGSCLKLDQGSKAGLCQDYVCLKNKDFLVPVVDAACNSPLNSSSRVIGFATVHIANVVCNPTCNLGVCSGTTSPCSKDADCMKYITLQPTFTDCRDPGNKDLCAGSSYGGSCPGCGTGSVAMVE
jgi:hypothetical protein